MEKGLSDEIENENITLEHDKKYQVNFFKQYQWNTLQTYSIWSFGPNENSPNILLNETLEDEVDQKNLFSIKDSIIRGLIFI
jgi:116 kDa U5 small nuclear ribonucleoprotein component